MSGLHLGAMDAASAITQGFSMEFGRLLQEHNKALDEYLGSLDDDQAMDLGRQGARAALAPFIWDTKVGDRWDIRRGCEFLRISRQALYKRVRTGTALGVPGRGTTYFPTWQFDLEKHLIRQVVGEIVRVFREADEDIDPLVIAAWATTENRFLEGATPAEWIRDRRDDHDVILAAHRATAGLAA